MTRLTRILVDIFCLDFYFLCCSTIVGVSYFLCMLTWLSLIMLQAFVSPPLPSATAGTPSPCQALIIAGPGRPPPPCHRSQTRCISGLQNQKWVGMNARLHHARPAARQKWIAMLQCKQKRIARRLRIAVTVQMETCMAHLKRKAAISISGEIVYADLEGYGRKTNAAFAETCHTSPQVNSTWFMGLPATWTKKLKMQRGSLALSRRRRKPRVYTGIE